MKIFRNGLITGLILQMAIGPVFFFIINLTLQKTIYDGLVAVIAVTFVDYLYIALSIFGVGKLLEKKKIKKVFGIISSSVLIIFGIIIIKNITNNSALIDINKNLTDILSSFMSTFLLTISSPMTIVFWTSLFTAKAIEYNYSKKELIVFGLAAGFATFIFMGTSILLFSFIKETVPLVLIQTLNIIVGCLLILYGGIRLKKAFG
ncbi:MAG: LysE family transporter [Candidatus Gracilibacteria bacterium]